MTHAVAYLAQGKIRLKSSGAPARTVESVFGNTVRERAVRAQQRHSWKGQGEGDSFLGGAALWGKGAAGDRAVPIVISSIGGGRTSGELIYTLESGSLAALLATDLLNHDERRLWNNNEFRIHHVHACPRTGDLAFSIIHQNGNANLGIMSREGGVKEITEGDSVDAAPRWVTGERRQLVFQSAGVGRDRQGHFRALGPSCIQLLDLETGEMTTQLENPKLDYLLPRLEADGWLYCIRRPYSEHARVSFWQALKDVLLLPFRILFVIFQFFNFLSMALSGRKLTTSGGARGREADVKQMMIWGNLVRAQQVTEENDTPDLVPSDWQLIRMKRDGAEEVVAKGVLAYDIGEDGTVVYSNGSAIFLLPPGGKPERIISEPLIEQVVLLPN
jgi:hypothetical protein